MEKVSTTKMSSKGQVVIPEDIRKKMNIDTGTQFIVVSEKDVIVLKRIAVPKIKEFNRIISQAKKQAKMVGLSKSDIEDAIATVRGSK